MKLTPENFKFGVDKVRLTSWEKQKYFIPMFVDKHNNVWGLAENNECYWYLGQEADATTWELWTPPTPEKKFEKRVMYKRIATGSDHAKTHWETQNMYKTKEDAMDNIHAIGYIEQECMIEVKDE